MKNLHLLLALGLSALAETVSAQAVSIGSGSGAQSTTTLTANLTVYVRTDGSDANDCSADTAAQACLTIQRGFNRLRDYDLAGFRATISVAAGTYASPITLDYVIVGASSAGNFVSISAAGAVVVSGGVTVSTSTPINLNSLEFNSTLDVSTGAKVNSNGCTFVSVNVSSGGSYWSSGDSWDASTASAVSVGSGAMARVSNPTFTGSPAYATAVFSVVGGSLVLTTQHTGTPTGTSYAISAGGSLQANYSSLPGNAAGTVTADSIIDINGVPGEVALNSDYTNATATFSSTALSVSVETGQTYSFTFSGYFADSTAADGAKFDFSGGTAGATNFRAHCYSSNATGAALVLTNANTTTLATVVSVALALTTQAIIECQGTLVPSSTGTFIVRAGQTAHTTGTLTMFRGSRLLIARARPL